MPKAPTRYDPTRRAFLEPSSHLPAVLEHAAAEGLAILTGVLARAALAPLRDAISRAGSLGDLLMHDLIQPLLEHASAQSVVTRLLGPKHRLSHVAAAIAPSGSAQTRMVAAQGYVTAPFPPWPLSVTVVWLIDPMTAENGPIRVMPDSGHYSNGPESELDYPEATPLLCPAGSIVVLDGRIWHQRGANTTETDRVAVAVTYTRPWILPRIDWRDALTAGQAQTLSPALREMLGFGARATRHPDTRHGTQIWLEEPDL